MAQGGTNGITFAMWVRRANAAGYDRRWERLIDFGNGPANDTIHISFDGDPYWDDALSCCYPMVYHLWHGDQFAGGARVPIGSGSFPQNQWVYVAIVHTPDAVGGIVAVRGAREGGEPADHAVHVSRE